jgi:tRNA threonylcarbamoyladenosine biosynthesis protein TsaB
MNLILNIDTSAAVATVTIAANGVVLAEAVNTDQKDHAAFLQPAIQSLLRSASCNLNDLAAIAVNYGPGSYTGIRVGMSSAKGLCYALNKPLIVLNALEILAKDVIDNQEAVLPEPNLYCPMIDARRMEVYTGIYNHQLEVILSPIALILDDPNSVNILLKNNVMFFGSGAAKWQHLSGYKNTQFPTVKNTALAMSCLSFDKCKKQQFADLIYTQPLYIKEFYTAHNV